MLLGIDQGTTGTTCLVLDEALRTQGRGYREVAQHYPRPGWVEQDPNELWESVLAAAGDALEDAGAVGTDLTAIGITNQRETTIVWDRASGRAGRTAPSSGRTGARPSGARELPRRVSSATRRARPDPYFSATNSSGSFSEAWLGRASLSGRSIHLAHLEADRRRRACDRRLQRLANPAPRPRELDWDDELLALFGVPRSVLPKIVSSSGTIGEANILGHVSRSPATAGDQQAALFGQACFGHGPGEGDVRHRRAFSWRTAAPSGNRPGGWRRRDGRLAARLRGPVYAMEGSVFVTRSGAAVAP